MRQILEATCLSLKEYRKQMRIIWSAKWLCRNRDIFAIGWEITAADGLVLRSACYHGKNHQLKEFNQADYMDYNMFGMGMRPGMRPGMGPGMGQGMRPGMNMGGMGPGGMLGNRPMGNGMGKFDNSNPNRTKSNYH